MNEEFQFTLDAASDKTNFKVENHYTKEDDALRQKWTGRVFCNPPYGRDLKNWVKKAYEESMEDHNELIVLLIPSRTDTSYWHDYIFNKAQEIRFLRGRVKFEVNGIATNPAPFPSAVVIYRKDCKPNAAIK